MEREKQKKIDRERQMKERGEYLKKKREEDEQALNDMHTPHDDQPFIPIKSKFVCLQKYINFIIEFI